MQPVYFPFSYMSAPVMAAVATCFERTTVIHPSPRTVAETVKQGVAQGLIDIQHPHGVDETQLAAVCADFTQWAGTHGRGALSYLKAGGDVMGFYDEAFSSQIGSNIKKYRASKESDSNTPNRSADPVFKACVFLSLAQELDMQQETIHRDLVQCQRMEKNLMENLKGETAVHTDIPLPPPAEDPGEYMTAGRLAAWARLMLQMPCSDTNDSADLFITASASVISLVRETVPLSQKIVTLEGIPILKEADEKQWRSEIGAYLQTLMRNPRDIPAAPPSPPAGEEHSPRMALSLFRLPEETTRSFLLRLVDDPSMPIPTAPKAAGTLIGRITREI